MTLLCHCYWHGSGTRRSSTSHHLRSLRWVDVRGKRRHRAAHVSEPPPRPVDAIRPTVFRFTRCPSGGGVCARIRASSTRPASIVEPVEGGVAADRVHPDHAAQHPARDLGGEEPTVELSEDLHPPDGVFEAQRDTVGPGCVGGCLDDENDALGPPSSVGGRQSGTVGGTRRFRPGRRSAHPVSRPATRGADPTSGAQATMLACSNHVERASSAALVKRLSNGMFDECLTRSRNAPRPSRWEGL